MDNIEISLDSSELSENSECLSSNVSLQSGVSGIGEYQGEFLELRQLVDAERSSNELNTSSYHGGVDRRTSIVSWYETQIKNLNLQLQTSQQQNEKYKQDLYNSEKKNTMLYNEKIEQLLKQNNELERNLSAANNQIQRLININSIKRDGALLENKILQLEKCNHDLTNQNYLLSNEVNQCNYHKNEVEAKYANLVTEVNEIKLELTAKTHSINELKKKIQEQHVQLKDVSQNNIKQSHSLDLVSSQLECVKKSEKWYREELSRLQKEKRALNEKLFETEETLVFQDEKIEHLRLELNNWKCICNELQLATIKENEKKLKQAEIIDNQVKMNETNEGSHMIADLERVTSYYEAINNDLINDLAKMKLDLENKQKSFDTLYKENSDLITKHLSLQNCLREREETIEKLENIKKDLKGKLSAVMDKQLEQNSKLLHVSKNCSSLEIEVNLKNQQKESVEDSVKIVREQFQMFKRDYNSLKDELHKKNKEILQLQYDKQQLYLNHNQKDSEEIATLKERCTYLDDIRKDLELANETHLQKIEILNQNISKLQVDVAEIQSSYSANSNLRQKYEKVEDKTFINLITELQRNKNIKNDYNVINQDALNQILPNQNVTTNVNDAAAGNASYVSLEDVIELLKYICKACITSEDDYINFSQKCSSSVAISNQADCVKILLGHIDTRLQFIEYKIASKTANIAGLTKKLNKLRRNVKHRIEELGDKCKMLQGRSEENSELLKILSQNNHKSFNQVGEITHLQDLLQVKIRDEKNKQKRYERNYGILLRKVKEHMKGRNKAEKHNANLQEQHLRLSDEFNNLRLQLSLKDSEISELHSRLENDSSVNEKLNLKIVNLEKEFVNSICTKCGAFDILRKRVIELEDASKEYKIRTSDDLKIKTELIDTLQKEKQQMVFEISDINSKHKNSINTVESLVENNKELIIKLAEIESRLTEEKSSNETLRSELLEIQNNALTVRTEKDHLNKKLEYILQENSYMTDDINHLNSCLHEKSEEVNELCLEKEQLEIKWSQKETNMQNVISGLRKQLREFENEVYVIRKEKFFLQRLCNDLKVALKIYVNHNKALKNQANRECKGIEEFDSFSSLLSSFPSPAKDDVYVNKLLQENKVTLQDEPLGDIQECFKTLRNEISVLQKQILEKNVSSKRYVQMAVL